MTLSKAIDVPRSTPGSFPNLSASGQWSTKEIVWVGLDTYHLREGDVRILLKGFFPYEKVDIKALPLWTSTATNRTNSGQVEADDFVIPLPRDLTQVFPLQVYVRRIDTYWLYLGGKGSNRCSSKAMSATVSWRMREGGTVGIIVSSLDR